MEDARGCNRPYWRAGNKALPPSARQVLVRVLAGWPQSEDAEEATGARPSHPGTGEGTKGWEMPPFVIDHPPLIGRDAFIPLPSPSHLHTTHSQGFNFQSLEGLMTRLDVRRAEAFVQRDRDAILADIERDVGALTMTKQLKDALVESVLVDVPPAHQGERGPGGG